ncbi:hypothetical protein IWZ00DRAFT_517688 [Phyllosticta capitalensis]
MASIFDLSHELLDMIFANLAKRDVFALRFSCRELRDASWNYCAQTYFAKLTMFVSTEGARRYNKLCFPHIKQSIRHVKLLLGCRHGSSWANSELRALLTDLPNFNSLTIQHVQPRRWVHTSNLENDYKQVSKVEWKREHRIASNVVSDIFLNLLVVPNSLRSIDIHSSEFKNYTDGLLRLDDLDIMARAAPLFRHNLANLVTLSLSLNTHISEEPAPDCYDALPTFLKGIPTLEEFTLVGTRRPFKPIPSLIFRALAEATTGEQRLPRLKLLRLKYFPVEQDALLQFISSHAKTLSKFQMTHIVLFHTVVQDDASSPYTGFLSTWPTFLKKLDEAQVIWELSTYELMKDQPQRAQRLNLRLWEKTPAREKKLSNARKDGAMTTVLPNLSTLF